MLRVFTAFSGYDSQCLALNRLGINYDLVGWSEIDKFAIKAHNALFPQWENLNFGDITQINWHTVPDFDLFTYSSPCQDFSTAGKMRGGEQGSGTRSSLLWECQKAIWIKRPRYLLMENVSSFVGKRFIDTFKKWLQVLEDFGYTNYWQVLNAKDYGIPQNRKRVFIVSVLNNIHPFEFPQKIELTRKLSDELEENVDKKYYIDKIPVNGRVHKGMSGRVYDTDGLAPTLTTNKGDGIYIQHLEPRKDGCTNTLTTVLKDNLIIEPEKVAVALRGREKVVVGWSRDKNGNIANMHKVDIANTQTAKKSNNTQNYILQLGHGFNKGCMIKDFAPTITSHSFEQNNLIVMGLTIRKMTEREVFRLMGVHDEDSDKIRSVVSKSQCYKLGGNSIVVDVLEAIFRELLTKHEIPKFHQLKLL